MKISKKLLWTGALALLLITTSATCEGGKGCDCPKFGQAADNGNDALAAKAAAGTLD